MILGRERAILGGHKRWWAGRSIQVRLENLKEAISTTLRERVAEMILESAGTTHQTPPVDTGKLEQSGSVFVGSKLIGTTNYGKGTPIVNHAGKKDRIYLIYHALNREGNFDYAFYQNYNIMIGLPNHHLWVEDMMAKERLRRYVRLAMREILNENR